MEHKSGNDTCSRCLKRHHVAFTFRLLHCASLLEGFLQLSLGSLEKLSASEKKTTSQLRTEQPYAGHWQRILLSSALHAQYPGCSLQRAHQCCCYFKEIATKKGAAISRHFTGSKFTPPTWDEMANQKDITR